MITVLEPPRRRSRLGTAAGRIAAVLVGLTLGALLASFATAPGMPAIPDGTEAAALAAQVHPGLVVDANETPGDGPEDLRGRWPDDLPYAPMPGWLQFLLGDATVENPAGVDWVPTPPGADADRPRLGDAENRLRADGWHTHRPEPGTVVARKGTLRLEFTGGMEPEMRAYRVPPMWHMWAVLAGAALGAAAAYVAAMPLQKRGPFGVMIMLGTAGVLPSFLIAAGIVADELSRHPWLDAPLWRDARHMPFGAVLNAAVVLLAVGVVRHVRDQAR